MRQDEYKTTLKLREITQVRKHYKMSNIMTDDFNGRRNPDVLSLITRLQIYISADLKFNSFEHVLFSSEFQAPDHVKGYNEHLSSKQTY